MPRPVKCRKVCCLPQKDSFGPIDIANEAKKNITMTIDEYETIRLIDFEGMTQEMCAEKMDIARTTVQRIYNNARFKLAATLVNGALLKIEGGDYKLCQENTRCGCNKCPKKILINDKK